MLDKMQSDEEFDRFAADLEALDASEDTRNPKDRPCYYLSHANSNVHFARLHVDLEA